MICLSTGALSGSLPTCLEVTSTETTTITSTYTGTSSTTTTTPQATISGTIQLSILRKAAFLRDPQVKLALRGTIAGLVGVPSIWVQVALDGSGRRLQTVASNIVTVAYTVFF